MFGCSTANQGTRLCARSVRIFSEKGDVAYWCRMRAWGSGVIADLRLLDSTSRGTYVDATPERTTDLLT